MVKKNQEVGECTKKRLRWKIPATGKTTKGAFVEIQYYFVHLCFGRSLVHSSVVGLVGIRSWQAEEEQNPGQTLEITFHKLQCHYYYVYFFSSPFCKVKSSELLESLKKSSGTEIWNQGSHQGRVVYLRLPLAIKWLLQTSCNKTQRKAVSHWNCFMTIRRLHTSSEAITKLQTLRFMTMPS